MQILIATKNKGKIKEIEKLISDLPLQVLSLLEFPNIQDIVEDGDIIQFKFSV